MDEQRSQEQQESDGLLTYSKWLFGVTSVIAGSLVVGGPVLAVISPGDARITRLYILAVVTAAVGALMGALLNLRKVRILVYVQGVALFGVIVCLGVLSAVIVFGGQPRHT